MRLRDSTSAVQLLPQPGTSFVHGNIYGCCALSLGNKILTSHHVVEKGRKSKHGEVAVLDVTAGARSLVDRIPNSCFIQPYDRDGRIPDNLLHVYKATG